MTPYINSSIQNNICYIEFFTPKHNALNSNMLDQLANKIEEKILKEDESIYMRMSSAHNPYGDGKAANRIVEVIKNEF